MVICWTLLEHKQRDLVVVGFTPSINSWEIVQLIKLITTQLLPAAGLLPFVFTQSNGVKEVDESCRYVWLAVWISGIRYPEVFPPPSLQPSQLGETKGGREILEKYFTGGKNHTLCHFIWRRRMASERASVHFVFFCVSSFSSLWFLHISDELCLTTITELQCGVFWVWQIREFLNAGKPADNHSFAMWSFLRQNSQYLLNYIAQAMFHRTFFYVSQIKTDLELHIVSFLVKKKKLYVSKIGFMKLHGTIHFQKICMTNCSY